MVSSLINVCRFVPVAGGTTDWVPSTAVLGYRSSGMVNGATYSYRAETLDLTQWEVGVGVYNSGTNTLARTNILFNNLGTTAKINFGVIPQVAITTLKEDLLSFNEDNNATPTQKEQARRNMDASPVFSVMPGGRLTPNPGLAVPTTDWAANSVIGYGPSVHRYVPIYDGTNVRAYQITSSDTDVNGLLLTLGSSWLVGTLYDLFVVLKAGVPTLVTGPGWSSAAAGASVRGYSLANFAGFLTNAAPMTVRDTNVSTFSVGANQATYVGLVFINGASGGTYDVKFGGAAAGGSVALPGLWNAYNRVPGSFAIFDTNTSWVPTAASTWQTLDGSTNNGSSFFTGLADDPIDATLYCTIAPPTGKTGKIALGVNAVTSPANRSIVFSTTGVKASGAARARVFGAPGNNFVRPIQWSDDLTTVFSSGAPSPPEQGHIISWLW